MVRPNGGIGVRARRFSDVAAAARGARARRGRRCRSRFCVAPRGRPAAALTVPMAPYAQELTFAPDAYWRGETHLLCDRPACLARILDELAELGVEQVIVASAGCESRGPHALAAGRLEGRARLGEYLQ